MADSRTGVEITEVRVKLTHDPKSRLKAYCSVTLFGCVVVRDVKVIDGGRGPFIAMPSRKLADGCRRCHAKNHLRASFCNQCGARLDPGRAEKDERGRARLHADVAHPIDSPTRIAMHKAVVAAYLQEVDRSQAEGYVAPDFEDLDTISEGVDADYLEELLRRHKDRRREAREARGDQGGAEAGSGAADS